MAKVEVQELLNDESSGLSLEARSGRGGLARTISVPRIQKPGLALTGYAEQLHRGRVLVLGGTEIEFLESIASDGLRVAIEMMLESEPACLVVTRGLEPPQLVCETCEARGVPLLSTPLASADFIKSVTNWLDLQLAPVQSVHGVMVDVLEVGILLLGRSGVGKSEAALELIERGHRLVADDLVKVQLRADGTLVGASSRELGHHMEIRGLGIINIADLFGITAIRDSKRLDLVVELAEWEEGAKYDRLGIEDERYELLGARLPFLHIPVRPGRNLASILEVAARNQLLRDIGHYSARDFLGRLDEKLARARAQVSE